MDREILFRAWDKNHKTIVQIGDKVLFQKRKITAGDILNHFEDIEIMQYTGLKDKNCKRIFEGDIVNHTDIEGGTSKVVYDKYSASFYLLSFSTRKIKRKKPILINFSSCVDFMSGQLNLEVIGNIHENPELLKGV